MGFVSNTAFHRFTGSSRMLHLILRFVEAVLIYFRVVLGFYWWVSCRTRHSVGSQGKNVTLSINSRVRLPQLLRPIIVYLLIYEEVISIGSCRKPVDVTCFTGVRVECVLTAVVDNCIIEVWHSAYFGPVRLSWPWL